MPKRISKRTVDATQPGDKDIYLWDDQIKGFGLKVTPNGHKSYLIQYRMGGRNTRTRRLTIGRHGKITAEQARVKAKEALGQILNGTDPSTEKDKTRVGRTLESLFKLFVEQHVEVRLKPKTQEDYKRHIQRYINPMVGNFLVHQINRQDIAKLHYNLRDTPYVANRVLALLSKFFNWCEKFGYRDEGKNPCRYIEKYKEVPRQRFLSTDEQEALARSLMKAELENTISPYAINAFRLLILTGARLGEIQTLKWDYVDFKQGILKLPDSKTGAKLIYLNDAAKDVLANMVRQADNPYVICGSVPGQYVINLQKSWRIIRRNAGLEDVRIHDLRHTFASVAVMNGMSLPVLGALLGHSQPRTTARYAHLAINPLREASNMVGKKLLNSG